MACDNALNCRMVDYIDAEGEGTNTLPPVAVSVLQAMALSDG